MLKHFSSSLSFVFRPKNSPIDTLECPARQCRLAILCWIEGGRSVQSMKGCGGYNSWLYSCCMNNSQNTAKSAPKRKRHPEDEPQTIQKQFSRRRYDTSETNMLTPPPNCGIPRTPSSILQRRIIGGRPAYFAEYPWQAHIRIKEFQCGGALVSRRCMIRIYFLCFNNNFFV